MVKKRELTVEKWLRALELNGRYTWEDMLRELDAVHGPDRIDQTYRLVNKLYEHQVAESWRDGGMQVYDFDPSFSESILGEEWMELLPDCIEMKPHASFYMKLPFNELNEGTVVCVTPCDGVLGFDASFFPGCEEGKGVYIGGDPRSSDGDRGRVVVNTGKRLLSLCAFAIPKELGHMVDDTPLGRYPAELVANGVAYLCSTNADIVPSYKPVKESRRNNAKRRSAATWHDVGYRIGSELRAYERVSHERIPHQGGTVRPHMRRAHWHHYWIGPRDGERKLVLKWVAPTMVGSKVKSATGHKVR